MLVYPNAQKTIFIFPAPDFFRIFVFQYSLTKQITISQNPYTLLPSNLVHILSVSSIPIGRNIKSISQGLQWGLSKKKAKIYTKCKKTYKHS